MLEKDWEVIVIRKLFFLEIVDGFNSIYDNLEYFLTKNNDEIECTEKFSLWVEEYQSVGQLKKWLQEKGLAHYYCKIYVPSKNTQFNTGG